MRCVRRRTLVLALALLAWPGAAHAADVTTQGEVVVRWHSNPDACAASGMCDRSGTLTWRPARNESRLDLSELSYALVDVFGGDLVARSYRATSAGTAACLDRPATPFGIPVELRGRRAFVVNMRAVDEFSFGHCAGPLASDFATAMPQSPPVSVAAARRSALIDLRGRAPFASGAFSGEVVSTLTLRTHREAAGTETTTSTGSSPPDTPTRKARLGALIASYAVTAFKGDAGFGFTGSDESTCFVYDSCGLVGDLTLHPDLSAGSVFFDSYRSIRAGRKETLGSALRALRAGKTRVDADGQLGSSDEDSSEIKTTLPLTESALPARGAECSDTGAFPEPYLEMKRSARGLALRLTGSGNSAPDPLRTRCPGPARDDLGALAAGSIPFAAVGRPQIEVTLRPSKGFSAFGLRGTGHGAITLSLKRLSIAASTRTISVQRRERL